MKMKGTCVLGYASEIELMVFLRRGSCFLESNLRTTRILLKLDEIEKKLLPNPVSAPMPKLEEHQAPPVKEPEIQPTKTDELENKRIQEKVIT